MKWLGPKWRDHLKNRLALWEIYELEISWRIKHSCAQTKKYYKLLQEKRELEEKNIKFLTYLSKVLIESQVVEQIQMAVVSHHVLDLHKGEGREADG